MRKPGKLQVVKVWVQLTNSLTKLDFHVNVDVDVDFLYIFFSPRLLPCRPLDALWTLRGADRMEIRKSVTYLDRVPAWLWEVGWGTWLHLPQLLLYQLQQREILEDILRQRQVVNNGGAEDRTEGKVQISCSDIQKFIEFFLKPQFIQTLQYTSEEITENCSISPNPKSKFL